MRMRKEVEKKKLDEEKRVKKEAADKLKKVRYRFEAFVDLA